MTGAAWACIAAVLSVGSATTPHAAVVVGQTFLAGSTDPTQSSYAWALTSHGISEKLFTVDKTGHIVGQLGESVKKLGTTEWEVTLKSGKKFSDGTPVTANEVVWAYTQLNQLNSGAQASLGTMTVTRVSDLVVKIQSERATPVMDAVLAEWPFVVYSLKGGQPIFTGPYKVEAFVAGEKFELAPNEHYHGAEGRSNITLKKYSSGQELAAALKAGQLDLAFHLPVGELPDLRATASVTVKSFEVGYHYMMFHNTRATSALADVKVRKAVDLALDRQALQQELKGGRGTRSLFPDYTPYFQADTATHGDKTAADSLLDETGWVKQSGSTARSKNGVPLSLKVVAYPQRPGLVTMLPVIAQTLAALGIEVNETVTSGDSWDELDQIIAEKDFDLMLWAQNTLPAGDPQWFLNAFFRSDGGNNHAGLSSATIDAKLDDLGHAEAAAQRTAKTAAVHAAILEEVPVSNLVTPEWHVGVGDKLSAYDPWGSDYYVIRADVACTGDCTEDSTAAVTTTAAKTSATSAVTTTAATEVETSNAFRAMAGGLSAAGLLRALLA